MGRGHLRAIWQLVGHTLFSNREAWKGGRRGQAEGCPLVEATTSLHLPVGPALILVNGTHKYAWRHESLAQKSTQSGTQATQCTRLCSYCLKYRWCPACVSLGTQDHRVHHQCCILQSSEPATRSIQESKSPSTNPLQSARREGF